MLRKTSGDRDENGALESLLLAAEESSNHATERAREAFLTLSRAEREILVRNLWVFDGNAQHRRCAERRLRPFFTIRSSQTASSGSLTNWEGWWFSRVVRALSGSDASEIAVVSVGTEGVRTAGKVQNRAPHGGRGGRCDGPSRL